MADTPPDDIDLMAIVPRLARLGTLLNSGRLADRTLAEAGVTVDRPALTVLVTLTMAGTPLRIGEIAKRMNVVGPHVTRMLPELERRGLARRVTDPHDRRARLIEATDDGSGAAQRYLTGMLGWFTGALADWSDEDRRSLGRLLARFSDDLTAHLAALEAPTDPPAPRGFRK